MKKDVTKGQLDLLLLAILDSGPAHGYAVISALRERSGGRFDLAEGSVYPALHRLEDLGLLSSDWQPTAGRRRRLYRITAEGSAALRRDEREWRSLTSAVDAVLRLRSASPAGGAL
jgi:PadR family transcriptional regulator, regulatory protein PadR